MKKITQSTIKRMITLTNKICKKQHGDYIKNYVFYERDSEHFVYRMSYIIAGNETPEQVRTFICEHENGMLEYARYYNDGYFIPIDVGINDKYKTPTLWVSYRGALCP